MEVDLRKEQEYLLRGWMEHDGTQWNKSIKDLWSHVIISAVAQLRTMVEAELMSIGDEPATNIHN